MTGVESRLGLILLAAEPSLQDDLADRLRENAAEVLSARDGTEVWLRLQRERIDAVVLDVQFAHGKGLELLKEIRGRGLMLPVILVTENGTIAAAVEAIRSGANDYLTLPLDDARLMSALHGATEDSNARSDCLTCRDHEARRQAQKMEVLGRLTCMVAHDLNNLMTVLMSCSTLLREHLDSSDSSGEFVVQIEKVALRAVGLTRQLLTYSRKQRTQVAALELNVLIGDLCGLLQRLLPDRIELTTDLQSNLGRVKVLAGQFEQVLMNLVFNARDAMPRGGRLTLQTSNVLLDGTLPGKPWSVPAGPYVLLAVKDTGHGMDDATRARLFEPFFTTKRAGEGTGLGLSIVWEIVRANGGAIEVSSNPGQGTTFRIYFPQVEETSTHVPDRVEGNGLAVQTVLVVEDSDGVRNLVRDLLRRQGCQVLLARSAAEALEVGTQHPGPIHLLVTNAVMPQMTGPALAEWLATRHPGLKVLYLSGQGVGPLLPSNLLALDTPLLEKPFTPAAFSTKVRALLEFADATVA